MMEMMQLKTAAIICVYLNVEMKSLMERRTAMMGIYKMEMDAHQLVKQSVVMDKLMGLNSVTMVI